MSVSTWERIPTAESGVVRSARPSTVPTGDPRGRLPWIDVARGAVVLLVVLMHVGIYEYLPLVEGINPEAFAFWTGVSAVLEDVRMPALLVISGWLASGQVKRGLGDKKTQRRIATNAWLYVLWLAIYAGLTVVLNASTVAQAVTPASFAAQLLVPYSTLWFLDALVVYTLFYSLTRKAPVAVTMGTALAVSMVTFTFLQPTMGLWVRIPQYLVFFGLGVHFKDAWASVAAHPRKAVGWGALASGVAWALGDELGRLGVWALPAHLLMSVASVCVVFGLATLVANRGSVASRGLAWVGRHTASVYVLHYPVLMLLTVVAAGPLYAWPRQVLASSVGVWLYPLIATAVISAFALAVHALADRLHLGFLFRLPRLALPRWSPSPVAVSERAWEQDRIGHPETLGRL